MTHGANVLAFVLAGGNGTRLHPLTTDDCKPALPFGHSHRVVDFVLANLTNSGIDAVDLLVQYRPQSLVEHVRRNWRGPVGPVRVAAPADDARYRGTADAVRQNLHRLDALKPDLVAVFGADHVYRMDVRQMIDFHLAQGADATVATLPVPIAQAGGFGIAEVDAGGHVRAFREKPPPGEAPAMPGRPGWALASMGNYVFSADVLRRALHDAHLRGESDFGSHVLPRLLQRHKLAAYDFQANRVPRLGPGEERGYWRDVGTIGAYFDAHLDTLGATPRFRLANPAWPVPPAHGGEQPAEIDGGDVRRSSIGADTFVDRALLDRSVIGRSVEIQRDARLEQCIVLPRSIVGAGARLRRVIVCEGNVIPDGEVIGYDAERDRARFHVDADGVVVVPRGCLGGRGAAAVEREAAFLD